MPFPTFSSRLTPLEAALYFKLNLGAHRQGVVSREEAAEPIELSRRCALCNWWRSNEKHMFATAASTSCREDKEVFGLLLKALKNFKDMHYGEIADCWASLLAFPSFKTNTTALDSGVCLEHRSQHSLLGAV